MKEKKYLLLLRTCDRCNQESRKLSLLWVQPYAKTKPKSKKKRTAFVSTLPTEFRYSEGYFLCQKCLGEFNDWFYPKISDGGGGGKK